jgi:hypothetical protein
VCSTGLFEAVFLPFVPQVRLRCAEIDNFWTAVAILFHLSTLFAVVSIRNTFAAADDAPALKRAEVAFVTDLNKGAGAYVAVANNALAIAFFTETTNRNTGLLPAEY